MLPVQVVSYSADEIYHDPDLNPIAARVTLSLKVLTYQDYERGSLGFGLAIAGQAMARGDGGPG